MRLARWGDDKVTFLLFALAHIAIFAGLFRAVYTIPYSGTGLFYDYAGKVLAGQVPYRDFVLEYPPLALLFFTLPRVLGSSFRWYYVWFQAQVVVFDLLTLGALYLAARWWRLSSWRVFAVYTTAVLSVGPITLHQFDIFSAALSLFAVVWFARGRDLGAAVFLALAVMTKVYPILLAPVFVILDWRRGERRRFVRPAIAFVATCVVLVVPWLVIAPRSLAVLFNYHTQRGIHLDSVFGTIAFMLRTLGFGWVDVRMSFASWNLAGPLPDFLTRISSLILLVALLVTYGLIARSARRRDSAPRDVEFVAHASALVLFASMAASKVLSPQYLIWVVPFVPLISGPYRHAAWAMFTVIGLLTYYMYPHHYAELLARQPGAIVAMGARNVLIVALAVLVGRSLRAAVSRADVPPMLQPPLAVS